MGIDGTQVGALARHVREGHPRRARRHHDWTKGMAVADAAGHAVAEALTELGRRLAPGEVVVDLAHIERYAVGLRGVKMVATVLVATNRRLWHLVRSDDSAVTAVPLPWRQSRPRRRLWPFPSTCSTTAQPGR